MAKKCPDRPNFAHDRIQVKPAAIPFQDFRRTNADDYRAFSAPNDAHRPHLQASTKAPAISKVMDHAMIAVERDNPLN